MATKETKVICTICPVGCNITVHTENEIIKNISGNDCLRGENYAKNEVLHPIRILTTTVKVLDSITPLLAVRSNKGIAKALIFNCIDEIKKLSVTPPLDSGAVIIKNILNTGTDITTCRKLEK